MSLKELCIKNIIECIGLQGNILKLLEEIPKTLLWQIIGKRDVLLWCKISTHSLNESDPDAAFSNIDWLNFDFDFDDDNIDLFLYIVTFKNWEDWYTKEKLCVRFNYFTYSSINICYRCYIRLTGKYNPIVIEEHYPVLSNALYKYVQDRDSWCGICIKKPLFNVYTLKECFELTHSYANYIKRRIFTKPNLHYI